MDKVVKWIIGYLMKQSIKTTAWIGVIGIVLTLLHLYNLLFILFIALVVFPEAHFSNTFKQWAEDLQKLSKTNGNG